MKKVIFSPIFFGLVVIVILFGSMATQSWEPNSGKVAIRKARAFYQRLLNPQRGTPQYNAGGLKQFIAVERKARIANLNRSQLLAAKFETGADKRDSHRIDITVFQTPQHPNVDIYQIKAFIDGKEFFRSVGSGFLGAPGTSLFSCAVPRGSQPRLHTLKVLNSATGETVTLHENF